jgi:MFS family permease
MDLSDKSMLINKLNLTLSIFFASLAGYSFFAFFPVYLSNLTYPDGSITFIMTFLGIGIAIFSSFFGRISDGTGKRKVFLTVGLVGQVCIFITLIVVNNLVIFCILTFLRGVTLAARMPASNALFADIVENRHNHIELNTTESEVSGRQLTLLNTIKSGGWAVGLIFSNIFMNLFGVGSLVVFLIITTILALIFALFVKDTVVDIEEIHDNLAKEELIEENLLDSKENDQSPNGVNSLLFIPIFLRQFGVLPFLQIIALILFDAGIDPSLIGIIVAINPLVQVLAMVLMGRLIDKARITEKLMMAVGFFIAAITLICYMTGLIFSSLPIFIIGQIFIAFSWACIQTGSNKYIVNRVPRERAKYTGYFFTSMQIAKIIGLLLFSYLISYLSYQMILPFAAILPLIAAIIIFRL